MKQQVRVIAWNIIAVATPTIDGWKAFIAPVAGRNHDNEWPAVLQTGTTVDEDIARAMFPNFADVPYGR